MVCLQGVDHKRYGMLVARGGPIPKVLCPSPECGGSHLRGHGWYRRYLDGELAELRRLRCASCKVTHALLPEDVCAYHDLTLGTLAQVLETSGGPSARARSSGQAGEAGRRRVRRWCRRLKGGWVKALSTLLPAVSGSWWQRVLETFGTPPETLVRLRHWLWSAYRLFFSGLTGLYRQGRPRWVLQGLSTDLGICPSD